MKFRFPFFTIGHSTRTLDEFCELLRGAQVQHLADIRKFPRSRTTPQFNQETLPEHLAAFDISYQHVAALGGRRGKSRSVPHDVNALWTNSSFHNYADYALADEFRAGLVDLMELGSNQHCVMMCSEAVWWRCHRRIVADHLIARGQEVVHIMGKGRFEVAHLTPGAVVQADGTVVYPAPSRI